ncbi:hypothetical protein V3O24_04445 [Methylobacter sp. Wu8]|uniref:hypothetical protein n=1 Tax=Methylobacter sp. Wu8 TaxID=3118457 RepID=UPI002F310AAA
MKLKNNLIAALIIVSTLSPSISDAKQKRSESAKNHFKASHPCPANGNTSGPCPGYKIDHIKPLACNGLDAPSNMQWQTYTESDAKDKWERKDCQVKPIKNIYQTSAKGACFTYSASGKKRYAARSFCR